MIYIKEKNLKRQFELFFLLASTKSLNMCAWLYPESNLIKLSEFPVTKNLLQLEPITSYSDDTVQRCSTLIKANPENLELIMNSESQFIKNCDSLALYEEGKLTWYAAMIGHEGMCLVRDNQLINKLTKERFNASAIAPKSW